MSDGRKGSMAIQSITQRVPKKSKFVFIIEYITLRFLVFLFWFLPWPVVYTLSEKLGFFLFYLIKKRRSLIESSLRKSFPDYSDEKISLLVKKTYCQFANVICENIKAYSLSPKQQQALISKRLKITNPEFLWSALENNPACFIISAHYGNWEWLGYHLSLQYPGHIYDIYTSFNNPYIDNYILKMREQLAPDALMLHHASFLKRILKDTRHKNPVQKSPAVIFFTDQNPRDTTPSITTSFLEQETRFITGPEKLAKQIGATMIYAQLTCTSKGYYSITFVPLTIDDTQPLGHTTTQAAAILAEQAKADPSAWLYLHNRWKKRNK